MKKLRYLIVAIVVVVVLLAVVPLFINANQFRPTVEEKLSAALQRQVTIGDLKVSLLSGSLKASNLAIADDPAFSRSPFLTARSLRVGVELVPLIFSKTLHITGLTIENPTLTLLRNPAGKWNFSSLAATGQSASAPAARSSTPAGGAAPDLTIKRLALKDGRVAVGSTSSQKQSVYEHLNLQATNVAPNSQFPLRLSVGLPGGGSLNVNGKAGPLDRTDASLTPVSAKLGISGLNLAQTGFVDPASGLAGMLDMTSDVASANGQATAKGTLKLDKFQLAKGGAPAGIPINMDFDSNYDLRRSVGTLNQGTVKAGGALVHVSGTFQNQLDSIVLNLKLNGENMPAKDVQSVLPALGLSLPNGASLQQGTVNANLASSGPMDKLVTTGNVGVFNAVLAGFDLASKLSALSAFTGMKSGNGSTSIEKLTTNLRNAPEGTQFTSMLMVLPALGQVSGNGTISNPGKELNFKMVAALSGTAGVIQVIGGHSSGGTQIPFAIQGTASDPKFIPNVGGIAGSMVGSEVQNVLGGDKSKSSKGGLMGTLGGVLGKGK